MTVLLDLLLPQRNHEARATSPLGRRHSLALGKEARKLQRSCSPQERCFQTISPTPEGDSSPLWNSSSRSPPPEAWRPPHPCTAESGPDSSLGLDALDESGRTALIHALEAGHLDCAAVLLIADSDPGVGQAARGGANALHFAAAAGQAETMHMLLRALAAPRRAEMVQQRAASPTGQWHGELTPPEVAYALGHNPCANMLRSYICSPAAHSVRPTGQ